LTPEYTEKMKKLIDNAIALETLRKKVKGNSAVMSKNRLSKRHRKHRHHKATNKTTLKNMFAIANHKI
jgi:hypothetical protein